VVSTRLGGLSIDAENIALMAPFLGALQSGSVVTVLLGAVIDSERL